MKLQYKLCKQKMFTFSFSKKICNITIWACIFKSLYKQFSTARSDVSREIALIFKYTEVQYIGNDQQHWKHTQEPCYWSLIDRFVKVNCVSHNKSILDAIIVIHISLPIIMCSIAVWIHNVLCSHANIVTRTPNHSQCSKINSFSSKEHT